MKKCRFFLLFESVLNMTGAPTSPRENLCSACPPWRAKTCVFCLPRPRSPRRPDAIDQLGFRSINHQLSTINFLPRFHAARIVGGHRPYLHLARRARSDGKFPFKVEWAQSCNQQLVRRDRASARTGDRRCPGNLCGVSDFWRGNHAVDVGPL
jgi:hypothetical protein